VSPPPPAAVLALVCAGALRTLGLVCRVGSIPSRGTLARICRGADRRERAPVRLLCPVGTSDQSRVPDWL